MPSGYTGLENENLEEFEVSFRNDSASKGYYINKIELQ